MTFTTRPEIAGTFGVATSTHWIASAVGMRLLERGGNAFDAAAAMGFVLHVVEPHLNGPLGDMPMLIKPAGQTNPTMVCGQGVAPAGATIEHFKDQGLEMIPGSGLLATVVPGAFDAWMITLRDHGSLPLRDILEPAIHYARYGHPLLPRVANTIAGLADFFAQEWPTSHATWVPGGSAPQAGALFCNPQLADTWERLLTEAEAVEGRLAQIEAARQAFYSGFIAEAIDSFVDQAYLMDASGTPHKGVLTGQDMAKWQASYEAPLEVDYHGWTVWKGGAWTQGPTLLQSLKLLQEVPLDQMDLNGAEFVHQVSEAMKLAFADREAYYGDPTFTHIPMDQLLSDGYAAERRTLIGATASTEQRPGRLPGHDAWVEAMLAHANLSYEPGHAIGAGEPTMSHLTEKRGDTVHLDVIDRWGNMVSATPSGGWLQSSPVVPGLGMPLNSRAQMFWLEDGLPTSLAPGRRPRTTLSPSMARRPDGTELAFGTPGGDQQDQWQLIYLLRLVHGELNLQEGIDAPLFHTGHFQSSFYPREVRPGHLMVEPGFGTEIMETLRAKGHAIEVAEPWTVGRLTAASRAPDGMLRAAATPRLMQAYAVGR
ncbi:Putative gamma-glutamyltransferase YwrD [Falsiruegeria litorea R37]|uniref:Putative gamma-glutamyltransferase YwrD n=1 Tax=Falsiruegeria litorea R37 TaxID=1200284 RepID=A0A1Y5T269_9RHOB|nr:gamma-glutamyltransferase family protein [Falsiruegeria litorea]SLN53746.1 Putative gamma-glutamyltransferase YwrD [Falsiruegeria litorea R37]